MNYRYSVRPQSVRVRLLLYQISHDGPIECIRITVHVYIDDVHMPIFFIYTIVATTCRRLSENLLVCDCHLRWLARWLISQPSLALFTECHQPLLLRDREIVELQEDDFVCHGES